ncbi:uncharacterized protein DNG_06702 [Cephalotrichum gorgonifer]|uniref:NADAR domain-containing protein n=1 Tax=Cephalotrichum gorgonifer TaxID=2041049 RepID=A0AAE8SWU8_9PEZI|nr:uncharacterized protein DNG_06702 [Cephalotrichum gorgonifer]
MAPVSRAKAKQATATGPAGGSDKVHRAPRQKKKGKSSGRTSLQTETGVYFWRDVDPDFGFLSQWYYCPFTDPKDSSIIYHTAEHYMMYQKALLFGDTETAAEILTEPSPQAVRTLGRRVTPFSDETWHKNRERIVLEGSIAKFTLAVSEVGFRRGNLDEARDLPVVGGAEGDASAAEDGGGSGRLRAALLETGDRELVEASPRDRIWGVGFGAENAPKQRGRWGMNLLGKALMETRKILEEGREKEEREEAKEIAKEEEEEDI